MIRNPEIPYPIPCNSRIHPNNRLTNIKYPANTRLLPPEILNNMASAQRGSDFYKNSILNDNSPPQESNVDHLRRLEENFSI